ncbi:hypothetical protein MAC_02672 [Metarhizium acridum CQMa 102]|uniref:Uncharacterized protein n=1 Tax=Metarhizium acridum (strain CQMa 102) TaxID=655827 RepID=E9DYH5_METAQ|nr:uncharacterized protein MAC_02672 [Metarhizium acridum CQMa 102]EFY91245.1 hypothetical protein MAC_02672 [Metarhizium acridum CQMa 102]
MTKTSQGAVVTGAIQHRNDTGPAWVAPSLQSRAASHSEHQTAGRTDMGTETSPLSYQQQSTSDHTTQRIVQRANVILTSITILTRRRPFAKPPPSSVAAAPIQSAQAVTALPNISITDFTSRPLADPESPSTEMALPNPTPPLLLTKRLNAFLHTNQTPQLPTLLLTTCHGKLLAHASPHPVSVLRTHATVAASLLAIHTSSSVDVPSALPGSRTPDPITSSPVLRPDNSDKEDEDDEDDEDDDDDEDDAAHHGVSDSRPKHRNGSPEPNTASPPDEAPQRLSTHQPDPSAAHTPPHHMPRQAPRPRKPAPDVPSALPGSRTPDPITSSPVLRPDNSDKEDEDDEDDEDDDDDDDDVAPHDVAASKKAAARRRAARSVKPVTITVQLSGGTVIIRRLKCGLLFVCVGPSAHDLQSDVHLQHENGDVTGSPSEVESLVSAGAQTTSSLDSVGAASVVAMRRHAADLARWLDDKLGTLRVPEEGVGSSD